MPLVVVLLLLVLAAPLEGQIRSVAIEVDNDALNIWQDRNRRPDEQYTHGARVRFGLATRLWGSGLLGERADVCGREATGSPCVLAEVVVGQAIYTPSRTEYSFCHSPDRSRHYCGHRPAAGWLYTDIATRRVEGRMTRLLGLQIGVTGSPSMAEQTQAWFHNQTTTRRAVGWAEQVPFEVGVNARFEERHSLDVLGAVEGLSLSLEPEWGGSLGTVRSAAEVGLGLRVAGNAPRPVGWTGLPSGPYGFVEVGVTGELVLRDIFLDGSTFGESLSVDKETFLPRREIQVGLGWGPVLLRYEVVDLGWEFHGQRRSHTYSSFGLAASW